jgi:hypothetical protein
MKFAIANPLETSLVEDLIDHYVHTELSEGAGLPLPRDKELFYIEPISTNGFDRTGWGSAFIHGRSRRLIVSD